MKKCFNPGFWEVWNEDTAEAVYVDHKPTSNDIWEICDKEDWVQERGYIKKYIHVDKLKVYSREER